MPQFKELTIQRMPNGILPHLPLNGKWLENINFTSPSGVSAVFENSCLTLTTGGTDLQVETRIIRKKPRTTLIINAFHLKRCGLKIGDKVGVTYAPNFIQIQKIVKHTTAETA